MLVLRTVAAGFVTAGALALGAAGAAAQTTTTAPPVPPIPVTGTPTTTAPAAGGGGADLAETGVAADLLVPAGLALVGAGAVMQAAARRPRRHPGLL